LVTEGINISPYCKVFIAQLPYINQLITLLDNGPGGVFELG